MKLLLVSLLGCVCFTAAVGQKTTTGQTQTLPGDETRNTYRKVSVQLDPAASESKVRAVAMQELDLSGENQGELELTATKRSPGGVHYTYRLIWNGLPVYLSSVKVNQDKTGRIFSILSNLTEIPSANPPSFSVAEASVRARITAKVQPNNAAWDLQLEQQYLITEGSASPVWRAVVSGTTDYIELVYDGVSGELLWQRDLATYHHHTAATGDTTGYGFVFHPDPLTSANTTYTGAYRDNADSDNAELNNERRYCTLKDITFNAGVFSLVGPYVRILDNRTPVSAPVTSTSGNFYFTRNEQGFEDVMCYFYVDSFQRYVQMLGFDSLTRFPLRVDPHGMSGADNSRYATDTGGVFLEFGEGGVDDAEDMDVIVHEYGHALSGDASPSTNFGTDRTGLDEGVGDYFCSGASKEIDPYRWSDVFTWDGHNEWWAGRSSAITTAYSTSITDYYKVGEVWASTLMQVHQVIGRHATDKDQLQELYMNASNMSLNDAAHNMLDADTLNYNGYYTPVYQEYFCARGIFSGPECIIGVKDAIPANLRWRLFPNPSATGAVTLDVTGAYGDWTYSITSLTGQSFGSGLISGGKAEIPTGELPAGAYFVHVSGPDGKSYGVKKLVVLH